MGSEQNMRARACALSWLSEHGLTRMALSILKAYICVSYVLLFFLISFLPFVVMDGTKVPMKQAVAMQRENDLIKTIKQLTCSEKYDLTKINCYFCLSNQDSLLFLFSSHQKFTRTFLVFHHHQNLFSYIRYHII